MKNQIYKNFDCRNCARFGFMKAEEKGHFIHKSGRVMISCMQNGGSKRMNFFYRIGIQRALESPIGDFITEEDLKKGFTFIHAENNVLFYSCGFSEQDFARELKKALKNSD